MSKNICITGPCSSGKTTFAISLANAITSLDKNKSCIICFCKNIPSVYPNIFPFIGDDKFYSLSRLMLNLKITPDIVSSYVVTKKNKPNIGYIGYVNNDMYDKYPPVPDKNVESFYQSLSALSSYIIFDCSDDPLSSPLTKIGLGNMDYHIQISSPDIKGITYNVMMNEYFKELNSKCKKVITILNSTYQNKYCDNTQFVSNFVIPYKENILSSFHNGNLLDTNFYSIPGTNKTLECIYKEICNE